MKTIILLTLAAITLDTSAQSVLQQRRALYRRPPKQQWELDAEREAKLDRQAQEMQREAVLMRAAMEQQTRIQQQQLDLQRQRQMQQQIDAQNRAIQQQMQRNTRK